MNCSYNLNRLAKELYLVGENAIETQSLYIDHTTPQTTISSAYKLDLLDISMTEETGNNGGKLPEFIYADNLKEAIDILFS